MPLRELLRHPLVTASREATMTEVARLMAEEAVDVVVVIDHDRPVGIVTARDIVVRGTARRYPADARIDSVMTGDVVSLPVDADRGSAVATIDTHAVRQVPLVDGQGAVVGLLSADDLLMDLAEEASAVAATVVDPARESGAG